MLSREWLMSDKEQQESCIDNNEAEYHELNSLVELAVIRVVNWRFHAAQVQGWELGRELRSRRPKWFSPSPNLRL